MKDFFINKFQNTFNTNNVPKIFFAPGRVNIIGEHTDYNGGYVMPFAINLGTYAIAMLRNDNNINFISANFSKSISITTNELNYNKNHQWANYPKAVAKIISEAGYKITTGFDVLFYGDLPTGAGLSSSASIELATAVMLNELFNFNISQIDLVKYSLQAENEYMGLNCGIMDQFAIGMCKKDNAVLLNTQNLQYEHIPLNTYNYQFIIVNSMKKRELLNSKFNTRQNECKIALKQLKKELIINNLCELNSASLHSNKNLIKNDTLLKRATHVISENERTINLSNELKNSNLQQVGELMNLSHNSLKNNYEVTGSELDILQEISLKQKGVIGSRMTGAGFGGCTISLVDKNFAQNFKTKVETKYFDATNLKPKFYFVNSSNGAGKWE
ncbi:MAG: galactokinase [Bacteroidales bacterium]|nr:galactokinase [Bacteroidales bacterium]